MSANQGAHYAESADVQQDLKNASRLLTTFALKAWLRRGARYARHNSFVWLELVMQLDTFVGGHAKNIDGTGAATQGQRRQRQHRHVG